MAVLFNNCRGRDHARLYGPEAFFDLDVVGPQADMATGLQPGDECVVAVAVPGDRVEVALCFFAHEQVVDSPDRPGASARVQFGTWLRSEKLPKAVAAGSAQCAASFNVNGHFKQRSVV